jgi:hypothetical protein
MLHKAFPELLLKGCNRLREAMHIIVMKVTNTNNNNQGSDSIIFRSSFDEIFGENVLLIWLGFPATQYYQKRWKRQRVFISLTAW